MAAKRRRRADGHEEDREVDAFLDTIIRRAIAEMRQTGAIIVLSLPWTTVQKLAALEQKRRRQVDEN